MAGIKPVAIVLLFFFEGYTVKQSFQRVARMLVLMLDDIFTLCDELPGCKITKMKIFTAFVLISAHGPALGATNQQKDKW
jgi:hypothetical protein